MAPLPENDLLTDAAMVGGSTSPPTVGVRHRAYGIIAAASVLGLIVLCAVAAPLLAPYDPSSGSLGSSLLPPVWHGSGSWEHVLGTDQLGRDALSRMIYGARMTLAVALAGVVLAGVVGTVVGLLAGYLGGLVDEVVMRVADAALAIPLLVLGLALATVLGPGTSNAIIVVSSLTWAFFARLVRGEVLALRSADYVLSARLLGYSRRRIVFRHILPNVATPIIVLGTLQVANTIVIASSLSFLGLGVPQPTPEWGLMLSDAQQYVTIAPTLLVAPGVALAITVLSTNVIGDWLRDRLDPRSKGVRR